MFSPFFFLIFTNCYLVFDFYFSYVVQMLFFSLAVSTMKCRSAIFTSLYHFSGRYSTRFGLYNRRRREGGTEGGRNGYTREGVSE